MNTINNQFKESLRIISAITTKDIVDAIKNRNVIANVITVFFVVVAYKVMPVLMNADELPRVLVYDAGSSSLVTTLEDSPSLKVIPLPSRQEMEARLADTSVPGLGLVIPQGFDHALAAGEQPELSGYVMHWVSASDAEELAAAVAQEITKLAGQPVRINTDGNRVLPRPDSTGSQILFTSLGMVITLTILGLTIVPHLMIEEKHTRTIDALLVSPASIGHVVIGKALTGMFYCLTVAVVILALYIPMIIHWGLAILATICGALLTVSLGLLLGMLFEGKQQLPLWGFLLLNVLLIPVFLSYLQPLLPEPVNAAVAFMPTVALERVFRLSLANGAPLALFGPELALIVGCAALVLIAVGTLVRRLSR